MSKDGREVSADPRERVAGLVSKARGGRVSVSLSVARSARGLLEVSRSSAAKSCNQNSRILELKRFRVSIYLFIAGNLFIDEPCR